MSFGCQFCFILSKPRKSKKSFKNLLFSILSKVLFHLKKNNIDLVGVCVNYSNALQRLVDHCIILLAGNQTLFGWQRKMKYSSELHLCDWWDLVSYGHRKQRRNLHHLELFMLHKNDEIQAQTLYFLDYILLVHKFCHLLNVLLFSNNWLLSLHPSVPFGGQQHFQSWKYD